MPASSEPSADPLENRPRATVAEARALAHPLRLRIIRLLFDRDLTNREIARVTGLTESNVGTILHRAVQAIRAEWDKEPEDE